ncbi:MAG: M23 family metallopeptidase [Planctomycetes bacterium]|nr:M23 family metallopeptidase [Planctomycetota bacterium]
MKHSKQGAWLSLSHILEEDFRDPDAINRLRQLVQDRRQKIRLNPPLHGRWLILFDENDNHRQNIWSLFARDFVRIDDRDFFRSGDGTKLNDYFGFDTPIFSAADGTVAKVIDEHYDMPIGIARRDANFVIIEHEHGEFTVYGHIKRNSAEVAEGEKVRCGQLIARIGNSGMSAFPHLHFTLSIPSETADDDGMRHLISVPFKLSDFKFVGTISKNPSFRTAVPSSALSISGKLHTDTNICQPNEGWVIEFKPAKDPS